MNPEQTLKPKFCINCGSPLIKLTIESHFHYECTSCAYIHWLNSRPCVDAIIVQEKNILLTQRGIEPHKGKWDLPGGFLELGEHPVEGLHREIAEELGAKVEIVKFIGHYIDIYGDDPFIQTLNCSYLCRLKTTIKFTNDDVVAYQWFPLENLPVNIAFPHFKQVLNDCHNDIIQLQL